MNKPKTTAGYGCMILFGLPFAVVGILVLGITAYTLFKSLQARSWEEVPAYIQEAELKEHSGDSTTYSVNAKYTYNFLGQSYTSDAVDFMTGADNVDDYHKRIADELKSYQASGKPFRCYVNPSNPNEAVLYYDLRIGHIALLGAFGIVFGGVGFALIGFTLYSWIRERGSGKKTSSLIPAVSNRADWQANKIKPNAALTFWAFAFFALIWNAISTVVGILVINEAMKKGPSMVLFVLIFPLVGIFLITIAVKKLFIWQKFKLSWLELSPTPGKVGEDLKCSIYLPPNVEPGTEVASTLTCWQMNTYRSGGKTTTRNESVWKQEIHSKVERIPRRDHFNYFIAKFSIPSHLHGTSTRDSNPSFSWQLETKASLPGADLDMSFDLPVRE